MSDKNIADFIRPPAVADQFYPGSHHKLRELIGQLLDLAEVPRIKEKILGFVVPHAGYIASGEVAAYSYAVAKKHPQPTALIMAPSHHAYFEAVAIFPGKAYLTPLGEVPINHEITARLLENKKLFDLNLLADAREHSLEVQLPFLQVVWKDFSLVALIMGSHSPTTINSLAEELAEIYRQYPVTIFASTDLSHYYPYEVARQMDNLLLEKVLAEDIEEVCRVLEKRQAEACGQGPLLTLMTLAKKLGAKPTLLKYANSGDTIGDKSQVVGYGAVVYTLP